MLKLFAPTFFCIWNQMPGGGIYEQLCYLTRVSSMIWRIIRICKVVDRFLWKPFWFFLNIFSASGRIRYKCIALEIIGCSMVDVKPGGLIQKWFNSVLHLNLNGETSWVNDSIRVAFFFYEENSNRKITMTHIYIIKYYGHYFYFDPFKSPYGF